jgi:SAM-dependent methyltransferase
MKNDPPPGEERPSSRPPFWNERYVANDALFGTGPNAFVREAAEGIAEGAAVAEGGAGEARNLIFLAKQRSARVTAVDFAEDALATARRRAWSAGVALTTSAADARRWQPEGTFDVVLATFLHLLPRERPASCRRLRAALRPGGRLVAEWFSTAHADKDRFAEIGPSKPDRLISAGELRRCFPEHGIERLEEIERTLDEGPMLNGRAAVVRLVWRKPQA